MANIIIAPQHQSAPKEPARIIQPFAPEAAQRADRPSWETYDREMDLPEYATTKWDAPVMDKSPTKTIEASLMEYEKNYAAAASQRWDGQGRWQGRENEEMRLVRIMHPHTFIRKLIAAGVNASYEEPRNGWLRARLWLNSWSKAGRVGVNAWLPNEDKQALEVRTVTSLQFPLGPEYSIMRFDRYNVPTQEKYRGWRTVLLSLITANVITEAEADRAFGQATGPASLFYREQLFLHRNHSTGLARY